MKLYTPFLLLLGFLLLTLSCSEPDLDGPKEHCPELIGEWKHLNRYISIPGSPFVLTSKERRNRDTLLDNIEDIKVRIDQRYQELVDSQWGTLADFRENGELIYSGNVLFFKCLGAETVRISTNRDFDGEVSEHEIIYRDSDIMVSFNFDRNYIWLKLD